MMRGRRGRRKRGRGEEIEDRCVGYRRRAGMTKGATKGRKGEEAGRRRDAGRGGEDVISGSAAQRSVVRTREHKKKKTRNALSRTAEEV